MPFYAESPFERIVNVHWKKKKPDEPPPGIPGMNECASGWLPVGGWHIGGDGYPSQVVGNSPTNLTVAGGVLWNFYYITQDPTLTVWDMFMVPGYQALSEKITVFWDGILAPPAPYRPTIIGVWYYGAREDHPPWLDSEGNRPPNLDPSDPDDSADLVGSGSLVLDPTRTSGTVVIGNVGAGPAGPGQRALTPPFVPSPLADRPFGFPGSPSPQYSIWIQVDHVCPGAI